MGTLIWLSLAFLLAVLAGGSWYAFVRGREAYRALRDALGAIGRATEDALGRLDAMPGHFDDAAAAGERLSVALERLSRSRKRLTLLLDAFAEVRASVRGAVAFK